MPQNAANWIADDDLLRDGVAVAGGRVASYLRRWRDRVGAAVRPNAPQADIRHKLGLWRYPDDSRDFLQALHGALRTYQPRPYDGPITVSRARTHKLFRFAPKDPDMGWRRWTSGPVHAQMVAAAHDTIVREPRVRQLAAVLSQCLDDTGSH